MSETRLQLGHAQIAYMQICREHCVIRSIRCAKPILAGIRNSIAPRQVRIPRIARHTAHAQHMSHGTNRESPILGSVIGRLRVGLVAAACELRTQGTRLICGPRGTAVWGSNAGRVFWWQRRGSGPYGCKATLGRRYGLVTVSILYSLFSNYKVILPRCRSAPRKAHGRSVRG